MSKQISIAAIPNYQQDDINLAKQLLLGKILGKKVAESAKDVKITLESTFGPKAFFFNSGRAALYSILKSINVTQNDEIIIQAFTCVALPEAITKSGAKPIFCDIDKTNFNFDLDLLEKSITNSTKAIIIQSTFGIIPDLDKIVSITKKSNHKIYLIVDCAHCLGAKFNNKKVEEYGDFAFYSFGQDKIVSCTQGGAAIAKELSDSNNLEAVYNSVPELPNKTIRSYLFHPILWSVINKTYYFPLRKFSLGKFIILVSRFFNEEKTNHKFLFYRLSNEQKILLSNQLKKLDLYNSNRNILCEIYNEELCPKLGNKPINALLRYPLLVENPTAIRNKFKEDKIILGNWYNSLIYPKSTDLALYNCDKDRLKSADYCAKHIINLPLGPNIDKENAKTICRLLKQYL